MPNSSVATMRYLHEQRMPLSMMSNAGERNRAQKMLASKHLLLRKRLALKSSRT